MKKEMFYITDLLVEGLVTPLAIDELKPKFDWKLKSNRFDVYQESYKIEVFDEFEGLMWDSGIVKSDQTIQVCYDGKELLPLSVYLVKVTVTNNYGEEATLSTRFETGYLDTNNIEAPFIAVKDQDFQNPVFFNSFKLNKKVKRARIYASSLGIYEIALNGKRVGDIYFAPYWTSYHHTLQYQTYDVTDLLNKDNLIEMVVNDGWYKAVNPFNEINMYGDKVACS